MTTCYNLKFLTEIFVKKATIMSKRRSPIWQFFTVAGNSQQYGKCHKCKSNVPRGGTSSKSYTTSNLVSHLRSRHQELYEEYNRLKETSKEESDGAMLTSCSSASLRQLTLQESSDRTRVWATNDAKALRVSRKIGEMIAIDCQPLSIVSDTGFVCLLNTLEP